MAKPKIQILVCTNEREPGAKKPSCGRRGSMDVYHRFKDRVKELGVRDEVMVTRTGCLKHCSQGTTVAVQPCNRWYRRVNGEAEVEEILQAELQGREAERLRMPDIPWE